MRKKFKTTKDELLKGANKGIETIINSETAKKAGKFFADYSSGLKDIVANQRETGKEIC